MTVAAVTRTGAPGARGAAIAAALLLGLAVGWLSSWAAGAAVLAFGLVVIARPLDPFIALVLVAGVAAFAAYGEPRIQRDLIIVTALTIYTLVSLFAAWLTGRWHMPHTELGHALTALGITTALGAAHGVLAHHSIRLVFLETFPLFSLLLALVVGGVRLRPNDLRLAAWALIAVAAVTALIGYRYYASTGMRTQGLPFSPVPGFVAVLVLTRILFDPAPRPKLAPVLLFCVLVGHQVVTFTRGYWFALLAAVPLVIALYVRRGEGVGGRWRKVVQTLALVLGVSVPTALVAATATGWSEIIGMLGERFTSSFETKNTPETVSNIVRLVELRTTMRSILAQPWLGYGHGATLIVRQFFYPMTGAQWWVHQSYVMMWFKQGLLGLAALLWVIVAALRTGFRRQGHDTPIVAGWCAASVGCTLFVAVVGLTNYHFFMVTLSFMLALMWGIALSFERPGPLRILWRRPAARGTDAGDPV